MTGVDEIFCQSDTMHSMSVAFFKGKDVACVDSTALAAMHRTRGRRCI